MSVRFTVRRRLTQAMVGIAAGVATLITTAGTAHADSGHELWLAFSDNQCAVARAGDLSGAIYADPCVVHGNNPPQAQWYFDAVPGGSAGYEVSTRIMNNGGACLTAVINGSTGSVHVTGCHANDPNQQWTVDLDAIDDWTLVISNQGLSLSVRQASGSLLALDTWPDAAYWSFGSPNGPYG